MERENENKLRDENSRYSDPERLFISPNLWMKDRIRNVLELIRPRFGDVILDMGCGMGTFTIICSALTPNVVGVDFSPSVLSIARRMIKEYGKRENSDLICADVQQLPLRSGISDRTICADLVEHLTQPRFERFLHESHRTLHDDGGIFIYTPDACHIFEKMKRHRIILREDAGHVALRTLS